MGGKYIEDLSIESRRNEIDSKAMRIRDMLDQQKLDALYLCKGNNFAWITAGGDNIVTRYAEAGVAGIFITKNEKYCITNNIEKDRMIIEGQLEELGFVIISQYWYENRTDELIRSIIGEHGKWAADIPFGSACDANPYIPSLQICMLDSEIARYMRLGEIFSEVIERYMATIHPGDSELKIAGGLSGAMWANGIEPVLFLVCADERIYRYRHAIPTENKLNKYLMISCNARYKGMITRITRCLHIGKPANELLEQHNRTLEIENRMALISKPGVDDLEAYKLAVSMYEDFGYGDMWKRHHQGGPQGYENCYYLITPQKHEIIQKNRIYGFNPSITGTKTEDAIIITDDAPVFVTNPVIFPKEECRIDGHTFVRPGILVIE